MPDAEKTPPQDCGHTEPGGRKGEGLGLEGGKYVPKTTWAGLQVVGGIFLFWLIIFGSIVYFGLKE
jgi:hypothetical protein